MMDLQSLQQQPMQPQMQPQGQPMGQDLQGVQGGGQAQEGIQYMTMLSQNPSPEVAQQVMQVLQQKGSPEAAQFAQQIGEMMNDPESLRQLADMVVQKLSGGA